MVFYNYKLKCQLADQLSSQWSSLCSEVRTIVESGRADIVPNEIVSKEFEETIDKSVVSNFAHWKCIDVRQQSYLLCLNPEYAIFSGKSALAEVDGVADGRAIFRVAGIELVGLQKSTVVFGHSEYHYSETLREAMKSVEQQIVAKLGELSKISLELYEGSCYA